MRRRLTLLPLLLMTVLTVFAVRAAGGWMVATQSDGTRLAVAQCGDEWFHYYVTTDGVPLVQEANGDFSYADVLGFGMKSSGVMAHEAALRSPAELAHVASVDDVQRIEPYVAARRASENQRRALTAKHFVGDYRSLCILVSFADKDFSTPNPKAYYERVLNERFYQEEGMAGSVHDYFYDQSSGQFSMTFDIVGPIVMPKSCKVYADVVASTLMPYIVRQAADLIDLRQYDWDGDNRVEQVFFIYAGYGANETSDSTKNCIWPHEGKASVVLDNGLRVSTYGCANELWVNGSHTGIGTICHELCHSLGLPDLYAVGIPSSVSMTGGISDAWELMDGGNYNNHGRCPPGFSGYEKMACGWTDPVPLTHDLWVDGLTPQQEGGDVYVIYNEGHPDEFYLLENRQQRHWDQFIPGHGLLVTHVDYDQNVWNGNRVNADTTHFRLVPIPADNQLMTYFYRSKPLAHAAYPYVGDDGTVLNDSLNNFSVPAARLYHANTDGSFLLNKSLAYIREADGLVFFKFSDCPVTAITAPRAPVHGNFREYRLGHVVLQPQANGHYRKVLRR